MLTQEDLKNISTLLLRIDIKGNEALAVAQLQLKINSLLNPERAVPVQTKEEAPTSE